MMIYRAGQKTPPGFSPKREGNIMNKTMAAKIILSTVTGFTLTIFSVHAGTIKPVSPATNSFSIQNSGSSLGPQLSLSGDGTFTTPQTFGCL